MMPTESDLFKSLNDEPRTPSTVDVRRAIVTGRRRVVRRSVGYAGAAAATAVAVAGVSVAGGLVGHAPPRDPATGGPNAGVAASSGKVTAPTSCTLSQLTVPGNVPMALVGGADPTGRYMVGRSYPKAGKYQAVIWHDGVGQNVTMPGDLEEDLEDVNSAGTAVGWSYAGTAEAATGQIPYVYVGGKVSPLPGVRHGSALAINEAGAIAGTDDDHHAAVVWPSATANPTLLPVPAGTKDAVARDIDEDGTTVGNLDNATAYVWFPDGTHRELPKPQIDGKPAATTAVFSISNGWATGVATGGGASSGALDPAKGKRAAGGKAVTVRWNVRTGEVTVSDAIQAPVSAVNAQGWLIGTDKQGRGALVTGTATSVVLPDLATHKADLSTVPNTVSDDGRIIGGQSEDASGTIRAVVWRCK